MTQTARQIAAIQLVGNAAALYLGYYWLGIGEARIGLLAWSFAIALFTALLFLWMHGAGFTYGRDPHASPFRAALRHLPALLVAALIVLIVYVALAKLQDLCGNPTFRLASWLTLKLRKPIKPAAVVRVVATVFWTLRWVVFPILLMPWISAIASAGFRARRSAPFTWVQRALIPPLLLCALWLPFPLLHWRPFMNGFALEMLSFIVRTLVAYLLFAGGLLALEGMPLFTQPKRAVSP